MVFTDWLVEDVQTGECNNCTIFFKRIMRLGNFYTYYTNIQIRGEGGYKPLMDVSGLTA